MVTKIRQELIDNPEEFIQKIQIKSADGSLLNWQHCLRELKEKGEGSEIDLQAFLDWGFKWTLGCSAVKFYIQEEEEDCCWSLKFPLTRASVWGIIFKIWLTPACLTETTVEQSPNWKSGDTFKLLYKDWKILAIDGDGVACCLPLDSIYLPPVIRNGTIPLSYYDCYCITSDQLLTIRNRQDYFPAGLVDDVWQYIKRIDRVEWPKFEVVNYQILTVQLSDGAYYKTVEELAEDVSRGVNASFTDIKASKISPHPALKVLQENRYGMKQLFPTIEPQDCFRLIVQFNREVRTHQIETISHLDHSRNILKQIVVKREQFQEELMIPWSFVNQFISLEQAANRWAGEPVTVLSVVEPYIA